jgi:hypothetical protein
MYHINVYSIKIKNLQDQFGNVAFWEEGGGVPPFTKDQKKDILEYLIQFGYAYDFEDEQGIHIAHKIDTKINCLLTPSTLYLSTSGDIDSLVDIELFATEMVLDGEFAKFSPTSREWDFGDEE